LRDAGNVTYKVYLVKIKSLYKQETGHCERRLSINEEELAGWRVQLVLKDTKNGFLGLAYYSLWSKLFEP